MQFRSPNCCRCRSSKTKRPRIFFRSRFDFSNCDNYCGPGVALAASLPLPSCFFSPVSAAPDGCPTPCGGAFTPSALYLPRPSPDGPPCGPVVLCPLGDVPDGACSNCL